MTPAATTTDRTHPNVTLAVLALGGLAYAMLSSAVVPALPMFVPQIVATRRFAVGWPAVPAFALPTPPRLRAPRPPKLPALGGHPSGSSS